MPRKISRKVKLAIAKQVLTGRSIRVWEPEIYHKRAQDWGKKYQAEEENGLEAKKKPGNPLSGFQRRKELIYEEQFQ